jgi:hypothetical protein
VAHHANSRSRECGSRASHREKTMAGDARGDGRRDGDDRGDPGGIDADVPMLPRVSRKPIGGSLPSPTHWRVLLFARGAYRGIRAERLSARLREARATGSAARWPDDGLRARLSRAPRPAAPQHRHRRRAGWRFVLRPPPAIRSASASRRSAWTPSSAWIHRIVPVVLSGAEV